MRRMAFEDGAPFRAVLVTRGRKTGREHRVWLRAVPHRGMIYLSRHRPDSDWYLNAASDPCVSVICGDVHVRGTARVVTDEGLLRVISSLKYPGDRGRAGERRVAIEVSPASEDP